MKTPQLVAAGTATINMTPMIDVVFLLIIFFLVSSHLAKQENNLALDLPEATSALAEESARETIVVNVLADGSWQVGGQSVTLENLKSVMLKRVDGSGEPLRLKLRTDRLVPYSSLEPILKAASETGIGDIGFSVFEEKTR